MNDITKPGIPFDILRAVSSVERPRPVAGRFTLLKIECCSQGTTNGEVGGLMSASILILGNEEIKELQNGN
jgi:hypothetical protein